MPQAQYKIVSTVRHVSTKVARTVAPRKPPKKLYLGGGDHRLVPGRAVVVSEPVLRKLTPELQVLKAQGAVKITNMANLEVDLDTLAVIGTEPIVAQPDFPLDSAARDTTFEFGVGNHIPPFKGGKAEMQDVPVPSVIEQVESIEELEEKADELFAGEGQEMADEPTGEVSAETSDEIVDALADEGEEHVDEEEHQTEPPTEEEAKAETEVKTEEKEPTTHKKPPKHGKRNR